MTLGTQEHREGRAGTNTGPSPQTPEARSLRNVPPHMVVSLLGALFSAPLLEVYNYNQPISEKQCG